MIPGCIQSMRTCRLFLVILLTTLLSHPALSDTPASVVLTEGEKRLVDQGDIIVREVATANKPGRIFEAIGLIKAPKGTIIQVLTEYEKYPEYMPNVSRIDIVEKGEGEAVLNYTLSLPLGRTKKYRLRIITIDHDNRTSTIQWQMQEWPGLKERETIRDTTGYWCIEEQSKNSSLVLYHVYTDPGPIPFGLGWIVDILSKNSVPEALLQTKERTERIAVEANRQIESIKREAGIAFSTDSRASGPSCGTHGSGGDGRTKRIE